MISLLSENCTWQTILPQIKILINTRKCGVSLRFTVEDFSYFDLNILWTIIQPSETTNVEINSFPILVCVCVYCKFLFFDIEPFLCVYSPRFIIYSKLSRTVDYHLNLSIIQLSKRERAITKRSTNWREFFGIWFWYRAFERKKNSPNLGKEMPGSSHARTDSIWSKLRSDAIVKFYTGQL